MTTTNTAPALPEELDKLQRRTRLPYLRKAAPDVLATAPAQRWDAAEVLRVLLAEEVTGRDAEMARRRGQKIRLPRRASQRHEIMLGMVRNYGAIDT